jgi:hypothetical protein
MAGIELRQTVNGHDDLHAVEGRLLQIMPDTAGFYVIRDTARDRQYGQAVVHGARDVDMTAASGVSWSPVGSGRPCADVEDGGQTDAGFSLGRMVPDRSTRPWHQVRGFV